ncbi:MAG TPA: tetratricopeptide repeat protein [Chthoniobacteraceae bacterium]|jgi:tetratricopeptide (TPR) repeat protein|nr:tetratricopeptide repeat protein [Chthoniobacteraceae bacterium]
MKTWYYNVFAALWLALAVVARGDDVNALIKSGDSLDRQLETGKALDVYLSAEKMAPSDADVLRRVAKAYAEMMVDTNSADRKRALGEKALDYATRAVASAPQNAMAQLAEAICYGRLAPLMDNKTKIAYSRLVKEHADKSLSLDPDNDLTYTVLGDWNYELAGLNPVLRAIAGIIYGQVPDASYTEAEKDYEKALQMNPNRLANHVGLGRTYAALGEVGKARQELEQGLSMPNREKDDPFEKAKAREALRKL